MISAASFGLLVWAWLIGTVYKNWYLGALEASFILNLGISAVATIAMYSRQVEIRLLLPICLSQPA